MQMPVVLSLMCFVWEQEGRTMLVTEFMENGDLYRALQRDAAQPGPRRLGWYRTPKRTGPSGLGARIALDVARGLALLHAHKVGAWFRHPLSFLLLTL